MSERSPRRTAVLATPKPAMRTPAVSIRPTPVPLPDLTRAGIGVRVKSAADRALAAVALIPAIPLMLLCGLLVRATSRGPACYTQTRVGRGGRIFTLYKIRTMVHECESLTGPRWSMPGDPRITPIGRLLRHLHLDELPQLFNVLQGDMSLVGPRPHVPGMLAADLPYEDLVPYYFQRHTARPGITGLAQVSGCRGSTAEFGPAISRIDYDLHYIEKWSLRMDVMIIIRTIRKEFLSGSGF